MAVSQEFSQVARCYQAQKEKKEKNYAVAEYTLHGYKYVNNQILHLNVIFDLIP